MKKNKGQSTVEAALILPVLFMLVFGIITIGWWMNIKQVATNAATEAAAIGASTNDNCQMVASARLIMGSITPDPETRVTVALLPERSADRPKGSILEVQVRYPLGFSFGFISSSFHSVVATGAARMDYYTVDGSTLIPTDPDCS